MPQGGARTMQWWATWSNFTATAADSSAPQLSSVAAGTGAGAGYALLLALLQEACCSKLCGPLRMRRGGFRKSSLSSPA